MEGNRAVLQYQQSMYCHADCANLAEHVHYKNKHCNYISLERKLLLWVRNKVIVNPDLHNLNTFKVISTPLISSGAFCWKFNNEKSKLI